MAANSSTNSSSGTSKHQIARRSQSRLIHALMAIAALWLRTSHAGVAPKRDLMRNLLLTVAFLALSVLPLDAQVVIPASVPSTSVGMAPNVPAPSSRGKAFSWPVKIR